MEFNQKLQELRKEKGLTQEQLASTLYVSRTAISKWESGRGYPNIDSLKAIAKCFSVSLDDLLSEEEIFTISKKDNKQKSKYFYDLGYGLLDLSVVLLCFLPFFANRLNGNIQSVSLITLDGVQIYLKTAYIFIVTLIGGMGALTLLLQDFKSIFWLKHKRAISLTLSMVAALLFIISLQPYPTVFIFALTAIKVFILKTR